MIAVEVKGRDPKNAREIVDIYRSPNKDMRVLEKLADWTGYSGRTAMCSINGGDLNLPYADWNGHMEKSSGHQVFLNRLVWENSNTQVLNSMTQVDALFYMYIVWPKSALTSCSNVRGSMWCTI